MKYRSFLIKYAEIGVKGKNRYLFEDALVKQIHHRLKNLEGKFEVTKEAGRIYAEASEDFDYDEVIDALQHVFGIVGICPMVQIEDNGYEDLKARWSSISMTHMKINTLRSKLSRDVRISSIRSFPTRSTATSAR